MKLKKQIKKDEGLRLRIYKDTLGIPTIYYGHRVRQGEVYLGTIEDAEKYLDLDIEVARQGACALFPSLNYLPEEKQNALIELVYNMGANKIKQSFPRFCNAVNRLSWEDAANELKFADGQSILSKWYKQVKENRAEGILGRLIEPDGYMVAASILANGQKI